MTTFPFTPLCDYQELCSLLNELDLENFKGIVPVNRTPLEIKTFILAEFISGGFLFRVNRSLISLRVTDDRAFINLMALSDEDLESSSEIFRLVIRQAETFGVREVYFNSNNLRPSFHRWARQKGASVNCVQYKIEI